MKTYMDFLVQFVRNPEVIGAVAPSSKTLARKMIDRIDFSKIDVVVEYGPGSGRITRELVKKLRPGTTFIALEINESMYESIRRNVPGVSVYRDSVVNIRKYLEKHNKRYADIIISGLPWAFFSNQKQNEIMRNTLDVLADGGEFATYAYLHGTLLPSAKRFKNRLYQDFARVEQSSVALLNIPPAFVYHCRK
ncbi:MAG: methyltransferase domain-containing protein [Candidatus Glassbacteria bacterium]|nr:methyltransferase domain-containing protein [Candidatus Glassbacteria bacterium]